MDIACPVGTPVIAVENGAVTETGKSATYGNYMKYITDSGYEIMYAHLKKAMVKKGDTVKRNQTVALSGDTGLVTGAHLHYSIRRDGKLLDPMAFISLSWTQDVKKEYDDRGETFY